MQIQKDYTKEVIKKSAQRLFLNKGFSKTSMRNIADASHVGLSNIYNYFKSKDELFYILVKPVICEITRMMIEHHNPQKTEYFIPLMTSLSEEFISSQVNEYMKIATQYHFQLKLLLFKSQGSSLEFFFDRFADKCTIQVERFLKSIGESYPNTKTSFSLFTIHIHTVWMFTFFREMIMHDIKPKDTRQIITEYITFECAGWKGLISR